MASAVEIPGVAMASGQRPSSAGCVRLLMSGRCSDGHPIDHALEGTTTVMRRLSLAAAILVTLAAAPCRAESVPQGEAFDVLGSVMDNSRKQLSAKSVLKKNNEDAEKFREKIIAGWWEFFQGSSEAKPGEFCTAIFQRAKRESNPGGVELFADGMTVSLLGPGGPYRGALLAFSPLTDGHQFPKLQSGQKVLVTLKQGDESPQTLNAVYMVMGKSAYPMIAFAVPSIEALIASIEDEARFEVLYQGQSIVSIAWHSGFKARDALNACLGAR